MKTFKFALFILTAIVLKACGADNQNSNQNESTDNSFSFFGNSQSTYEFKDPKTGILVSAAEYPSDWKVVSKAEYNNDPVVPEFRYRIKDSDGMQAFNTPLKMFYAGSSPQLEQQLRMAGLKNVKSLMDPQQLVQAEIAPKLRAKGFSLIGSKAFPELEQKARKEAQKVATLPFELSINGYEWQNDKGQKAMVFLNHARMSQPAMDGQTMMVWMFSTDLLISDENEYDANVADFVEASLTNESTPEWDNYMAQVNAKRQEENRRKAQENIDRTNRMAQQSAIAHRNRMAQQQANFDAHQKTMAGLSAVQDASHASFMNNNFGSGSSYGQQSFVNMIHGEETVTHPNGNTYQIESGAKETWMDNDGNSFYSDDLFFDPNADPSLNNTEWSKVWEDF